MFCLLGNQALSFWMSPDGLSEIRFGYRLKHVLLAKSISDITEKPLSGVHANGAQPGNVRGFGLRLQTTG
jgi:hypothetical protein